MESVDDLVGSTRNRIKDVLGTLSRNKSSTEWNEIEKIIAINQFSLADNLQKHAGYVAYYNGMKMMTYSCIKECQRTLEIVDGELYDYYKTEYDVNLSTNEVKHYITHDKVHRELTHVISVLEREYYTLSAIVDAFEARGYSLNNLVKLKVLEYEQRKLESPVSV